MSSPIPSNLELLTKAVRKHTLLLLFPIALFCGIAAYYSFQREPTWKATQSFQIRDEFALGRVFPGRFESLDTLKMVQQTIYETVKRQALVSRVLTEVGPDPTDRADSWPTISDVERFQEKISLFAPNGAELGQTEVLSLSVEAESVERAKKIVGLLALELQNEVNRLRDQKAQSVEKELEAAVEVAQQQLQAAREKLKEFETSIGSEVIGLRSLVSDNGVGPTLLASQRNVLLNEMREARLKKEGLAKQLEQLQFASQDSKHLLSFSSDLLAAQPILAQLKDRLIAIQAQTAVTLGQFEDHHPRAKAALRAEDRVHEQIRNEILIAENGLRTQVGVITDQIERLTESVEGIDRQLDRLASNRAPYTDFLKQKEERQKVYNQAVQELARVRAIRAATQTTHLISLIDQPFAGSKPEGLSNKILLAAAGFAGLISGFGLVFFASVPAVPQGNSEESIPVQRTAAHPPWRSEMLETLSSGHDEPQPLQLPQRSLRSSTAANERASQAHSHRQKSTDAIEVPDSISGTAEFYNADSDEEESKSSGQYSGEVQGRLPDDVPAIPANSNEGTETVRSVDFSEMKVDQSQLDAAQSDEVPSKQSASNVAPLKLPKRKNRDKKRQTQIQPESPSGSGTAKIQNKSLTDVQEKHRKKIAELLKG